MSILITLERLLEIENTKRVLPYFDEDGFLKGVKITGTFDDSDSVTTKTLKLNVFNVDAHNYLVEKFDM